MLIKAALECGCGRHHQTELVLQARAKTDGKVHLRKVVYFSFYGSAD